MLASESTLPCSSTWPFLHHKVGAGLLEGSLGALSPPTPSAPRHLMARRPAAGQWAPEGLCTRTSHCPFLGFLVCERGQRSCLHPTWPPLPACCYSSSCCLSGHPCSGVTFQPAFKDVYCLLLKTTTRRLPFPSSRCRLPLPLHSHISQNGGSFSHLPLPTPLQPGSHPPFLPSPG